MKFADSNSSHVQGCKKESSVDFKDKTICTMAALNGDRRRLIDPTKPVCEKNELKDKKTTPRI